MEQLPLLEVRQLPLVVEQKYQAERKLEAQLLLLVEHCKLLVEQPFHPLEEPIVVKSQEHQLEVTQHQQ